MKGIVVGNILIREKERQVDRDMNMFQIFLQNTVMFGTLYDESIARPVRSFSVFTYSSDRPDIWDAFKDATNDYIVAEVFQRYTGWKFEKDNKPVAPNPDTSTQEEMDAYEVAIQEWHQRMFQYTPFTANGLFDFIYEKEQQLGVTAELRTI